jgi:hypothetical protein
MQNTISLYRNNVILCAALGNVKQQHKRGEQPGDSLLFQ